MRLSPVTIAATILLVYLAALYRCTISSESLYLLKHCNKRHQGGNEARNGATQICDMLQFAPFIIILI